ncbi:PilN domain-containing protein [Vibrio sp.]|nr:PilN domain-containing protein [Vibrio sp.]
MLHDINLLSWREKKKEEHQQRFIGLAAAGVLLAVGMQWGVGTYIDSQASEQTQRIRFLDNHIATLDKRIMDLKNVENDHKALITRLEVVESLQQTRNKTTDFMNALPNLVPPGVYIDKINMDEATVEMSGISDSTSRLATMLKSMESSAELLDVYMHSIVHNKERFGKKFQTFKVSFEFDLEQVNQRHQAQGGNHG